MTRPIKCLATFVAVLALFYLFGAFAAWDWNAGNWPAFSRFTGAVIAAMAASSAAFIVGANP